jgi:hypothetical protein
VIYISSKLKSYFSKIFSKQSLGIAALEGRLVHGGGAAPEE